MDLDFKTEEVTELKYLPGARAPRTGVYVVTHERHRLSHLSLMEEGDVFPACRKCGDAVRFRLHMRSQFIHSDRDFAGKSRRNRAA